METLEAMRTMEAVESLVLTGEIILGECVADENGERGTLEVVGSSVVLGVAWSDGEWAFRVTGAREDGEWTRKFNCSFGYHTELGESLSNRINDVAFYGEAI